MAPVTQLEGMLSFKGSMQPIQISGIDPQAEAQVSIVGERLVGGSLDALKPGEYGVIIGLMTARRFGLKLGDKLTLIVLRSVRLPVASPRMQRLNVVGVFKVAPIWTAVWDDPSRRRRADPSLDAATGSGRATQA